MSQVVYRYRKSKPDDGHLLFKLHGGAQLLFWTEHWHGETGWEVIIDVLEDTSQPREDRRFFLCNAGDQLDVLGEFASAYYVGHHESKAYASFLFETTHLADQEREKLRTRTDRIRRPRPERSELSSTERMRLDRSRESRNAAVRDG